jgi:hypothetical protein
MAAKLGNYGVFTTSMRHLVATVKDNPVLLPDVTAEVSVLEQALSAAEEAKKRQETHRWNKQVATQEINAALVSAQNAAIQIQNAAKFKLGARSEALVAFQVKPLRKHGSRKSAQLKAQEEALKEQEAVLQKQENELLKKEVELLRMKDEPAAAS